MLEVFHRWSTGIPKGRTTGSTTTAGSGGDVGCWACKMSGGGVRGRRGRFWRSGPVTDFGGALGGKGLLCPDDHTIAEASETKPDRQNLPRPLLVLPLMWLPMASSATRES